MGAAFDKFQHILSGERSRDGLDPVQDFEGVLRSRVHHVPEICGRHWREQISVRHIGIN